MKYPKTSLENKRVICPKCEKTFSDRSGFRYHWRKHHNEKTNINKNI